MEEHRATRKEIMSICEKINCGLPHTVLVFLFLPFPFSHKRKKNKAVIFSLILSLTFSEKTTRFDETEHCLSEKMKK